MGSKLFYFILCIIILLYSGFLEQTTLSIFLCIFYYFYFIYFIFFVCGFIYLFFTFYLI